MPPRIETAVKRVVSARQAAAELGHRLAIVRELRGYTMAQVEKMTGKAIERSALSRIENGNRSNPSLATLIVLCVAYEMDVLIRRDGRIEIRGTQLSQLAQAKLKDNDGGEA